jgi:putative transposase
MPRGYERAQTAVHLMNYHFAWCPKYQRKIFTGKIAQRLEMLIREKAAQLGCEILNLSIASDHVHMFIQAYPLLSPNRIIAQIKGYTSRLLRREFPELLKMPTLWTRSYFVSTAGSISGKVIAHYIDAQKGT